MTAMVVSAAGLSLEDLRDAYAHRFPNRPGLWVDKGWLMGVWVIGALFARHGDYYGAFPHGFLERIDAMFPARRALLHLFSGSVQSVPGATTLDIRPECAPDVVHDAHLPLPFPSGAFDLVLADPPYTPTDAKHYGTRGINRALVMRNTRPVVEPGGYLLWLDTVRPMYRKTDWQQVGAIAVLISTNTRVRCLSIFRAVP